MRRLLSILLLISCIFLLLTSCGAVQPSGGSTNAEGFQIVVTIFPEYDWVRNVIGSGMDGISIDLLMDNGVDLHSYQPTAADILKIATCDLFIYVGGESDEWVDEVLEQNENDSRIVLNLLEILGDGAKEEEIVEGMQAEEEEEDSEIDEHVWLSLRNAQLFTEAIADAMCTLDSERADTYLSNAENYSGQLKQLDAEYAETIAKAGTDTLLFGDRFPFRYLCEDYGLSYYAAFAGCSAETEASFETILFLAGKVDELGLKAVMTLETGDGKVAETIIQNTAGGEQKILVLDSMQSATKKQAEEDKAWADHEALKAKLATKYKVK